ncbi:MAG TPA: SDR family oxidoreductase [Solirubrobacteraceae bacterium]|jgi:NAD(P)-dependent dehydrogenase (short-subunit alcohol dehydrogenase family)|nr:SDR family oxidoreductase [Solirubrobacteraceae bacterium]
MRLEGKTAIITGGASGIGAATVRRFVKEGARVLIADRNEESANAVAAEVGDAALAVACDVRVEEDIQRVATTALDRWGRIDVLVNNAGSELNKTYDDTTIDDWNRVMETDLRAPWLFCKYVVPSMIEHGGGSVVNVASLNSLVGFQNSTAYGAAKGGLAVFTLDIAVELASSGVRFNAVCPGVIDTPMTGRWWQNVEDQEAAKAELAAMMPIGRLGRPDEIASAILFFASDDSTLCQGAILPVDGAYVAR